MNEAPGRKNASPNDVDWDYYNSTYYPASAGGIGDEDSIEEIRNKKVKNFFKNGKIGMIPVRFFWTPFWRWFK